MPLNNITRFIALTVLGVGSLAAQDASQAPAAGGQHNFAAHEVDMLAGHLSLNDAQKTQVQTILENQQASAQPLNQQLRSLRTQIQDAVTGNNVAQIDTLAAQEGTLLGKLSALRMGSQARIYALLNPDQQAKFKQTIGGGPGFG